MLSFFLFALFINVVVPNVIVGPEYSGVQNPAIVGDTNNPASDLNENLIHSQNDDVSKYDHLRLPNQEYYNNVLRSQPGYMSPVPTESDLLHPNIEGRNLRSLDVKNSYWSDKGELLRSSLQPSERIQIEEQSNLGTSGPRNIAYNSNVNIPQNVPILTETGNYGHQIYKPLRDGQLVGTLPRYNAKYLSTNQRIRDILSSTNHRKRYLVVHPNGTVEHVDTLDIVSKNHPNYVLLNSGDIIQSNNKESEYSTKSPTSVINSVIKETNYELQNTSTLVQETHKQTQTDNKSNNAVPQQLSSPSVSEILNKPSINVANVTEEPAVLIVKPNDVPLTVTEIKVNKNPIYNQDAIITTTDVPNVVFKSTENNVATIVEDLNPTTDSSAAVSLTSPGENKNVVTIEELNDDFDERPVSWFRTDENFWDKLSDNEDDITYFFVVKPPHRLERDTTRTVLANGTIVEEFTESVWRHAYDIEPVVTKTINIINPED